MAKNDADRACAPRLLTQDERMVAVDKPAGWPVIATRDSQECHVQAWLEESLGQRVWVVHRIDRDTSGTVIFARDAGAHRLLCQQFEQRTVLKRYHAITLGAVLPDHRELRLALHAARKGKMRPAQTGESDSLEAQTRLQRLDYCWLDRERRLALCLVEAIPKTGRQHQIRVHLRSLHAPIVNDALYGIRAELAQLTSVIPDWPLHRLALHATSIEFDHPSGARMQCSSPLPDDFQAALQQIAARRVQGQSSAP